MLRHKLYESVDGKRIMLGRNGKMLRRGLGVQIPALQKLRLLDDLARITQKLRPVLG
ncbi:hypothetical protein D3C78_1831490 [compost metagenome]